MKTTDHDLTGDFDALVHPSQLFEHPAQVVSDPDLSLNEKRATLASWASDACAIEATPALRKTPSGGVVSFDEIMDAMRALDQELATAQTRRPTAAKSASGKQPRMSGQGNRSALLH
jgi:hypothetical protein